MYAQRDYTVSMGETTIRSIRIPDNLWAEAKTIADNRYETLSEILRRALVDYVEKNR